MTIEHTQPVEALISRGMERQSAARAQRFATGASHRGWKVAFTTTASRAAAGVNRSVVGYLTDATEITSGASVEVGGWTRPMIEAELALFLTAPLNAGSGVDAAAAAIGAIAVAIEVVDVALPMNEVEEVLAGDIFHRYFMLGQPSGDLAGGVVDELRIEAWIDDQLAASEDHPATVIGDPRAVILAVAAELEAHGLALSAGDVVIAGSAIPLTPVEAGNQLRVMASGLGELDITFVE